MDRHEWDERYAGTELLWRAEPNQFLPPEVADLELGRVLDVACGEGRNAIWLAGQGWRATGVDFSEVALAKAARLATDRGVTADWIEADVRSWDPPAAAFDLVILFYLQLPSGERRDVYRRMAHGVAPDGTMIVVGHHSANLSEGYGGPKDADVLFTPEDVAADLAGAGLDVVRAEPLYRHVATDEGEKTAIDALVRAARRAVNVT